MPVVVDFQTTSVQGGNRFWRGYACNRCGGVVTAWAGGNGHPIQQMFPEPKTVDADFPSRAKAYLSQAIQSLHAPAGAVILAASAVDALLKEKKYIEGSLKERINKAAADHLITTDMAQWAHDVRIDANDQRHADHYAALPSTDDAMRCIEFAQALGQILFVLPARVKRGQEEASKKVETPSKAT